MFDYDKKVYIKFQCLTLKVIGLNMTQECNLQNLQCHQMDKKCDFKFDKNVLNILNL